MKNIILYGGAFNPPTNAHVAISQAAVEFAEKITAEFWLMPSGDRLDKSINVPIEDRLAFCRALLSCLVSGVDMKICTHEISQYNTQTKNTVEQFRQMYPNYNFIWLFGSDSIQTMPKWHGGENLFSSLNMLVVQRVGHIVRLEKNMIQLDVEVPKVSSTQVRQNISEGISVDNLVPKAVYELL